VKDCHHQIERYCYPDLRLHRVGTRSVVVLDFQVAFDPFEKQLDFPPLFVKLGHSQCRNLQVICQEYQMLLLFFVVKVNLP
jgi:hypothetical protein